MANHALLLLAIPLAARSATPPADGMAKSLFDQAERLLAQGTFAEALDPARKALALREIPGQQRGAELGWSQVQVARLLCKLGRPSEAEPLTLKALDLFRALNDRKGLATAHLLAGDAAADQEAFPKALPHYKEALLRWRELKDPAQEALTLNALGGALYMLNEFGPARDHFLLARQAASSAGDRAIEAEALKNLGYAYDSLGEPAPAIKVYEEALQSFRALGDRQGEATTLNALGTLYDGLGEKATALDLYRKALATKRELKDERGVAVSLTNLGSILTLLGDKAAALEALNEALALHRKVGARSGEAETLNYLGHVYRDLGDTQKALQIYQSALPVFEALNDRVAQASLLSNIGKSHSVLHDEAKAFEAYTQALALFRAVGYVRGEGVVQAHLGYFHENRGEFPKAQECYASALELHRKAKHKGAEAKALDQLGRLEAKMGHPAKGLDYFEQALPIHRTVGDKEAEMASLAGRASMLPQLHRAPESTALFTQAVRLQEDLRENTFVALSDQERLALTRSFERIRHTFLAHTAIYLPKDPGALQASFTAWIRQKGAVLDSMGRIQAAVLRSDDPAVRERASALQDLRLQLARLALKRPGALTPEAYQQKLQQLKAQKETLEAELAKLSQRFAVDAASIRLDAAALAARLPKGAAYVDFARVPWFDFETQKAAPAHYLAFLLRPGAPEPLSLIDLGPAKEVDTTVEQLRQAIQELKPVSQRSAELHRKLMQPLLGALKGYRQLIISPDGALNLVPFELLTPLGGRPLVERFLLGYLSSAKDLVRPRVPATTQQVAVLADPAFDLGAEYPGAPAASTLPFQLRGLRRSADIKTLQFTPLPRTAQEATSIQRIFGRERSQCFLRAEATEARLQSLKAPRILHLATHGYFLGAQGDDSVALESPMLRSGLALARANASIKREEDEGLFSAEKVLGLDLYGTELVVLSACDTGLGRIMDGEGVFGLKRAFLQVGARSLLVSLWPVPDRETRALMTRFYEELAKGRTKTQALADAKRAIRAKRPHPLFWAGFVMVGE